MLQPLTRRVVTLFSGLCLLGGIVACGGSGSVPPVAGGAGAASSSAIPLGASNSKAKSSDDCDEHGDHGDRDDCTGGTSGTGGGTVTTYQNVRPLGYYSSSGMIDFLVTPVTIAPVFTPTSSGPRATNGFVVPMQCSVSQPVPAAVVAAIGDRTAAAASATPPPTPVPTNLPRTACVIVAYANGVATPVTGFGTSDGTNLYFAPTSPGITYSMGTNYTFYVAIATTTTTSGGGGTCDKTKLKNKDGRRNEDDNGNHKDCGYHNGDDDGDGHDH